MQDLNSSEWLELSMAIDKHVDCLDDTIAKLENPRNNEEHKYLEYLKSNLENARSVQRKVNDIRPY